MLNVSQLGTQFSQLISELSSIFSAIYFVGACDVKDAHYGCRIDNGQCTCAFGCKAEFRYLSRTECQNALKVSPFTLEQGDSSKDFLTFLKQGRSNNICNQQPCNNGGLCIQISHSPGYKCTCLNGYFGSRCQRSKFFNWLIFWNVFSIGSTNKATLFLLW